MHLHAGQACFVQHGFGVTGKLFVDFQVAGAARGQALAAERGQDPVESQGIGVGHEQRQVGLEVRDVGPHQRFFGNHHVGRVAHHYVEREAGQRRSAFPLQDVGFQEADVRAVEDRVFPRRLQRRRRYVQGPHGGPGQGFGQAHGNAAAARAHVEDAHGPPRVFAHHPLHQFFGLGPGNEHVRVDAEREAVKVG